MPDQTDFAALAGVPGLWKAHRMAVDDDLLERETEWRLVAESLARAAAGSGSLVVIDGETGIGKSTLLAKAFNLAKENGFTALRARATELEQRFTFGVVRQFFETAALGRPDSPAVNGVANAAADPFSILRTLPSATGGGGDEASFALLHALYWLMVNLAAERPVAIFIDDIHLGDPASIQFLLFLAVRVSEIPVAIVITAKSGKYTSSSRLISGLLTEQNAVRVTLGPLNRKASDELVRRTISGSVPESFCDECYRVTSGVPFMVKEFALAATEKGVLRAGASGVAWQGLIPKTISLRVSTQLEPLGAEATEVAQWVAVVGDTDLGLVAQLTGMSLDKLIMIAEALVEAEIFRESLPLAFTHPLVSAAVYDNMSLAQLTQKHGEVARLLASHQADAERVAAHVLRAHLKDPFVLDVLLTAAKQAAVHGVPDSVVSYLDYALTLELTDAQRLDILSRVAKTALSVDPARAEAASRAALRLAREPDARALLADNLARALLNLARPDEAIDAIRAVQRDLPEGIAVGDLIQATLVQTLFAVPEMSHLGETELASRITTCLPQPGPHGRVLHAAIAGYLSVKVDDLPGTLRHIDAALAGGPIIETPGTEAWTAVSGAIIVANAPTAAEFMETSLVSAHRSGSILAVATVKTWRGLYWLYAGDLIEAEDSLRGAIAACDLIGAAFLHRIASSFLAMTLAETGRIVEGWAALGEISANDPTLQMGYSFWPIGAKARLLLASDRASEALEWARRCGAMYASHQFVNPAYISWRTMAAEALRALDRLTEAAELVRDEVVLTKKWGDPRPHGRALRVLSSLVDRAERVKLLYESVDVLELSSAKLEAAKSLVELGRVLRHEGQRAAARPYLARGLDLAYRCGASPVVDRARAELRIAGGRPRRVMLGGPGSLTPSELRVAEFATAGLTNKEIAQELFVTIKTVEVHLSNVYRKLEVQGRGQLARAMASSDR